MRPQIKTFFLMTTEVQSLEESLLKYKLTPKEINDIKRWNPGVANFKQMPVGTKMYVEIPFDKYQTVEIKSVEAPVQTTRKQIALLRREVENSQRLREPSSTSGNNQTQITAKLKKSNSALEQQNRKLSFFYTYSQGDFVQTVQGKSVETSQNSPLTLGLSYQQTLSDSYALSSSAYYSHLSAVETAGLADSNSLRSPYEYGLTSYLELRHWNKSSSLTPYIGIDYESFDAYNVEDMIASSEAVAFKRQNLLYGTAGVSSSLNFWEQPVFLKFSVSQSVFSRSESDSSYAGRKLMVFLATPITKDWSAHFLFKRHDLSGPTELEITRMGVGLAYHF